MTDATGSDPASRTHEGRSRGRHLIVIGAVLCGGMVILAMLSPWLGLQDPSLQLAGAALEAPSGEHLLGTDKYGRDVFSRVLHGGRLTLLFTGIALLGVVAAGTVIGAIAASAPRVIDTAATSVFDLLVSFPAVIVALALAGTFGPSMVIVLGGVMLVMWAPFARLSRALVRQAMASRSAQTARALGSGPGILLVREIWPRLRGPVVVLAAVEAGQLITIVAGLSFLGLGAQPPSPEWGAMLQEGRATLWSAPHVLLGPGLAVLATVLGLTCLGEGMRDYLDAPT
ncbi:ABC transporter permease [Agromyces sp. NPDC058136]|uniref:ABC transporter permease n=1 Tax=Agromyces sp. NPDC058136 TaxID=3346354 RepID=UPI0036DD28CE